MTGEPLVFSKDEGRISELKQKFRWVTSGPNCPTCNLMRGRVYPMIIWWDLTMPGFHPYCDCKLEPVGEEVQESSLDLVGVEPWIDDLPISAFAKWMLRRLLPFDLVASRAIMEEFHNTGSWEEAFANYDRITSPNSVISHPSVRIHNTRNPFPQFQSWTDWFFTPNIEAPPTPSASLPHEEYR